jgi:uncharacterized protein (DUF2384 family)
MESAFENLLDHATTVFQSRAKAKRWLCSYHRKLNTTPIKFAETNHGEQLVVEMLKNIKITF